MDKFANFQEISRRQWGKTSSPGTAHSVEEIQLGCMLRIAEATEAMAKEHTKLIRERDFYDAGYKQRGAQIEQLSRSNAALRGTITRLKKQLAAAKQVAPTKGEEAK